MGMGEGMGSPAGTVFFADIAPPGMEGVTLGVFRSMAGIGHRGWSAGLWRDCGRLGIPLGAVG